jgi:hypothetical protein
LDLRTESVFKCDITGRYLEVVYAKSAYMILCGVKVYEYKDIAKEGTPYISSKYAWGDAAVALSISRLTENTCIHTKSGAQTQSIIYALFA